MAMRPPSSAPVPDVALATGGVSKMICALVLAFCAPGAPVCPWSLMLIPSVTLVVPVKVRLPPVMKVFMLASEPVSVRLVAVPPTVTPPPVTAASVPLATVKVAGEAPRRRPRRRDR